jgi:hypothetical protein
LPVFPARITWNIAKAKYDKVPAITAWQSSATTNTVQVTDWFTHGAHVVPGIELRRAGLVVLDADRHHGGADGVVALQVLVEDQIDWPPHPIVVTAGGGEHHVFQQRAGIEPLGNGSGTLPAGIDVRGAGGWLVAPGSVREDGKAWKPAPGTPSLVESYVSGAIPALPDWLLELIRRRPDCEGTRPPHQEFWTAAAEARVRSALTAIVADDREAWLHAGMALHDTHWPSAREIWETWSKTSAKYDADDQEKTWKSLSRTNYTGPRITLASVFAMAIDNGWTEVTVKPDAGSSEASSKPEQATALPLHWLIDGDPYLDADWLVEGLLPKTGSGLISGPWGSYKSFIAVDLSGGTMDGTTFAGRVVRRRGGVLFIAVEGAIEVPKRIRARHLAAAGQADDALPFAWVDQCPLLLDKSALPILEATAKAAAERMQADYGLPLVLIIIDTMASASGYEGEQENQTGPTQRVMNVLRDLSRATDALVIGVDHFGKNVETGTRGGSAKEGAADFVLAILGERDTAGRMTNTRLAVRKLRQGATGVELPFTMRVIEPAPGQALSTLVVDWSDVTMPPPSRTGWPKKLRTLKRAIDLVLDKLGIDVRPFDDGPLVKAAELKLVREEYYTAYPADGDEEHQLAAKQKAFQRHLDDARDANLAMTRRIGGMTYVWIVSDKGGAA